MAHREYKFGSWVATISKHPRREVYHWEVEDEDGNDMFDFYSDQDADLATEQEAEDDLIRVTNVRLGHSPKRQLK